VADTDRAAPSGTRRLYDADAGQWTEVPVYERTALGAGRWIEGPALVVEDETTTHVIAGFEARASRLGALVLNDTTVALQDRTELVEVEAA
jgi:N-methylhydantoinase A